MTDLFLSYKAEDRARVAPLVQALETDGLSVWWDAHIGGGDEWRDTILRHLEAARAVIVVWSRRSIGPNGQFVRDEATRALKRGTYLPVRIDKVDPPLGFRRDAGARSSRLEGRPIATRAIRPCFRLCESGLGVRGQNRRRTSGGRAAGVNRRAPSLPRARRRRCGFAVGLGAEVSTRACTVGRRASPFFPSRISAAIRAQAYFSDGIAEELRSACRGSRA